MILDRALRYTELSADQLVGVPLGHQRQDLPLSVRYGLGIDLCQLHLLGVNGQAVVRETFSEEATTAVAGAEAG